MVCNKCGHEVSDDSKFCPICGEQIVREEATPMPPTNDEESINVRQQADSTVQNTPKQKSPKGLLIALAVLCVLFAGIAVFEVIQVQKGNEQIDALVNAVAEKEAAIVDNTKEISKLENDVKVQNDKISQQEAKIKEQTATINEQEERIDGLVALNDEYFEEWLDNYDEIYFYEKYACIVADDGTKQYHVYGCPKLEDHDFWIYNLDAAEGKGYYACPKCH